MMTDLAISRQRPGLGGQCWSAGELARTQGRNRRGHRQIPAPSIVLANDIGAKSGALNLSRTEQERTTTLSKISPQEERISPQRLCGSALG